MTLPTLIAEVEKLEFNLKPTVLSKLNSAAAILAQHPQAAHLLAETEAPEPPEAPEAPKPPKAPKVSNSKPVKPGSDMPVGG